VSVDPSPWVTLRQHVSGATLRAARAEVARRTPRQSQDLALAQAARELADNALDTREPVPPGTTVPLAIGLYRDAIFWALSAGIPGETPPSPSEVLGEQGELRLLDAVDSVEARDAVRATLAEPFASWARRPLAEQERLLNVLGQSSRKLVEQLTAADRTARWGALLRIAATVVGALFLSFLLYQLSLLIRGPDYALGKPWRASSSAFSCRPERSSCGGASTSIFFHTAEEQRPWLEIDLGAPVSFSEVIVHNRSDCCLERAAPLLIEAGNHRDHLVQIARREEPFDVWHARFKPQTARYLKLSVQRRSILHLERVEVRR
jgi:hypothetical protein